MAHTDKIPDFFSSKEASFNLKELLSHYVWRHWYWYLLFPALAYFGAWVYLRYAVPEYEVRCSLLIKDEKKGSGLSEIALLKELGAVQETKNVENEVQILKSQTLMEEVLRELKLSVKYFAVGRVKNEEMYGNSYVKLYSFNLYKNDITLLDIQCLDSLRFELSEGKEHSVHEFGKWFESSRGRFFLTRNRQSPVLDQGQVSIQIENVPSLARHYSRELLVKPMSYYSSVLEMKLRDPIARRAADILNKLVEVYNRAAIEDKNTVSQNTIKFIDHRLLYLTDELSSVESGVQDYKQQNQIGSSIESGMSLVLEELSRFEEEISKAEIQRSVLQGMENYLAAMPPGKFQLLPAKLGNDDESLAQLMARYNEKVLDRDRLAQTALPDNPSLLRLDQELRSLQANIRESLGKSRAQQESRLAQLRTKKSALSGKVSSVPRMERELQEIMRQQNIKQNLYLFLLQKREETQLALASTTPSSRVVDPARPNNIPVSPQKKLIYILAVLFGLTLPVLLVMVKDLLNDTVQGESDLRKVTDVPILGGIALSKSGQDMVVTSKSRSAVAEKFRLLRTNIQFMLPPEQEKGNTLLITSSASGDGKTFITANLGMAMAISGKKTALLELDLRKPKLGACLGAAPQEKGITNFLLGQAKIQDIVRPTELHENLFYIPCGPLPPNPAELIMYPALDQLFAKIKTEFDFILIDTSPVGLVADALLLDRFSHASLYVVRQGQTQKAMLKTLVDIQQEQKLKKIAVVLNGVKEHNRYEYGYGYGYYEEEPSRSRSAWQRLLGWFRRK